MSSVATQKKIASALNYAVELSLKGEGPNEAIKTAALRGKLNPEMTDRVVEAFNIAQTRGFLKVAKDRTANFPIASKEEVRKLAFADQPLQGFDAPESQSEFPNVWEGRHEVKVASIDDNSKVASWGDPGPAARRDLADLTIQVRAHHQTSRRVIEDERLKVASAQEQVMTELSDITRFFGYTDNAQKFAEFEVEALAELGIEAKPLLDSIYKTARLTCARIDPSKILGRVFHKIDYMPQITKLANVMEAQAGLEAGIKKVAALRELQEEQSATLGSLLSRIAFGEEPEVKVASASDFLAGGSTSAADLLTGTSKTAAPGEAPEKPAKPAEGLISSMFGKPTIGRAIDMAGGGSIPSLMSIAEGQSSAIEKDYEAAALDQFRRDRGLGYIGKGDTEELDNLRRQVILQDLLLNDEILSTQDPGSVAKAYNALLRINPRATLVPDVTRSVLRNSLANSAIDPYTAEQLAKLEGAMGKNSEPQAAPKI